MVFAIGGSCLMSKWILRCSTKKALPVTLITTLAIFSLCWKGGFTVKACELGWADNAVDGPHHGYAGVFGEMFCIPSETCPGGEPGPLWAEIWTNYADEQCWDLYAAIGTIGEPTGAGARVDVVDEYSYPSPCWIHLDKYYCDGSTDTETYQNLASCYKCSIG